MSRILPVLFFLITSLSSFAQTKTGLDILSNERSASLKGKRVGFICNQTSLSNTDEFGPDLLLESKVKLAAIFSPEHGFTGIRKAGVESDTATSYKGIPIYSLYGGTRKPTKAMLAGITTLVFDIQDIGVRPYTYLSTMILAMEAAAENKIEFIVLDRPNPLGGDRIEGNMLDTTLKSFVGQVPVPYIHGMTLGELAQMAKGERWFNNAAKLNLHVVKLQNWKRHMRWSDTKLEWMAPSPNIPTPDAAFGAAMVGAIGELGILSIGMGTDAPFLRIGSRLISQARLHQVIDSIKPFNVQLIDENYTAPFEYSTKYYNGIRFELPASAIIGELYSMQFKMLQTLISSDTNLLRSYNATTFSTKNMFDKVTGTRELRRCIESGGNLEELFGKWRMESARFREARKKYLLYN
jgi:uncharacterized protein YbbC (DUF1343 family)